MAAWLSQKVFVFSVILDAHESDEFSCEETKHDFVNRILPSIRNAVEAIITVSGNRLEYMRKNENGKI